MTETEVQPIVQSSPPIVQSEPSDGLTPEGRAIRQTLEMAKKDARFAALPEVKSILEKVEKMPKAEAPIVSGEEETEGEDAPKSSVFARKAKLSPEFKTIEEQNSFIKEKFGAEPSKFYSAAEQWRNDSQELPKEKERAENLQKIFEEMPEPIYNAIQAWGKGQDWNTAMKDGVQPFDYSVPFSKQTYEIVNHYFPNKFSQEEIKDTTDPIVSNAIEVANAKFDLAKGGVESARAKAIERADKAAESMKISALSSVAELQKSFPDFDSKELSQITKILNGGDVSSLFFKKDGTYRPDAAKRLAFMLYGEQEIVGKKTKAKKEVDNEAMMELISRGSDRPRTTAQQSEQPRVPEEIAGLLKGVNKKPTY